MNDLRVRFSNSIGDYPKGYTMGCFLLKLNKNLECKLNNKPFVCSAIQVIILFQYKQPLTNADIIYVRNHRYKNFNKPFFEQIAQMDELQKHLIMRGIGI